MVQYIDKSALVAEIERMLQEEYPCDNSEQTTGYHCALYELQDFLDTLEVKEVDLEEEATHYLLYEHLSPLNSVMHQADLKAEMQYIKDIEDAYKAGFKLGLKAQKWE